MKKYILSALLFGLTFISFSQIQGDGGIPKSSLNSTSDVQTLKPIIFSQPNIQQLRAEDQIVDSEKSGPWRFAYNHITDINMENSGEWSPLSNGGKIWRVSIQSNEALTLNFFLKDVQLPNGNELFIYDPNKTFVLGSFTAEHLYLGKLGTELIPGDQAILEYYVSPENINQPHTLSVDMIGHGYRTSDEFYEKVFRESGSCNMNVACPDGSPWENQIRSTIMLVSGGVNGSGFCSGAMINNTLNDGKPYVLTANHCYSTPTSWVFRFNWQSSSCQTQSSSPSFKSLSGAVLRARRVQSDFCLVEITGGLENGTVPSAFNTYFSGWDKSQTVSPRTIGIHHPSGDIKKISFDDNSPLISNYSGYSNNVWRVVWDRSTTTEGGSSGSPLFNQNGRIIGQLWGGTAGCNNLAGYDAYGALFMSWDADPSQTAQLKFWLDPNNSGDNSIEGFDPTNQMTQNNAGISSIITPEAGLECSREITPKVILKNYGLAPLTTVQIITKSNNIIVNTYNWTGNLASNQTVTVTIPSSTLGIGTNAIDIGTKNPNGQVDENEINDSQNVTIDISDKPNPIIININTDCYATETRWQLVSQGTTAAILKGGNITVPGQGSVGNFIRNHYTSYSNLSNNRIKGCLDVGCYTFTIFDQGNDGLESISYGCSRDGDYSITNDGNTTYVTMTQIDFGNEKSHDFCIDINSSVDKLDQSSISIYPNPSNGIIAIQFNDENTNSTYVVMDMTGRTVDSGKMEQSKKQIDFSHLAKGKYIIQFQSDAGSITKSFVLR